MVTTVPIGEGAPERDIKQVPQSRDIRMAIRALSSDIVADWACDQPPTRRELECAGEVILSRLTLPNAFLGFTMVALSNAFWREAYTAVPCSRRLLLLPRCLAKTAVCAGSFDALGLHCAGCGACVIAPLQHEAEQLGCRVMVAEGTTSVLTALTEGKADAILGVACLDSLEKSFAHVADLGVPHIAIPLLRDGCVETETDLNEVRALLRLTRADQAHRISGYLPVLRQAAAICDESVLYRLLQPHVMCHAVEKDDPLSTTEAIAVEWLRHGGKRFRPFITIASYLVARHGVDALAADAPLHAMLPDAVRRLALAIEVMHKASLIHDDIEDGDVFRYGRPTLHREYGVPMAINVGDFLVGLGYRLIAGEAAALGSECVADVVARLTAAHTDLCRGQGAELRMQQQSWVSSPLDVLKIGALKTAPAFEVAIYAGVRAARVEIDSEALRQYATYFGEAYQVLNDLQDWRDDGNKAVNGADAMGDRPTILRAFAIETGGDQARERLNAPPEFWPSPATRAEAIRELYASCGAFARAEALAERLKERAVSAAEHMQPAPLRDLLTFLVRSLLHGRSAGDH